MEKISTLKKQQQYGDAAFADILKSPATKSLKRKFEQLHRDRAQVYREELQRDEEILKDRSSPFIPEDRNLH
jgi:hypothetical protein